MEKELKISELASIWNVSVPTTWNRVKKIGLKTFIKKNETNKDINYVSISDEQINEYVVNVNNNINNPNNNGYYEETLSDNNIVNKDDDVIDAEYTRELPRLLPEVMTTLNNVYYEHNQQLININNTHNEQLENVYKDVKNVYEELAIHKANTKLLEDKKASEGLYLNEIKELKQEKETLYNDYNELKITNNNLNNEKENYLKSCNELNKKLEVVEKINKKQDRNSKIKNGIIAVLLLAVAVFVTIFIMDNKNVNNVSETVTNVQEQAVTPQVSQPVKNVSNQRER